MGPALEPDNRMQTEQHSTEQHSALPRRVRQVNRQRVGDGIRNCSSYARLRRRRSPRSVDSAEHAAFIANEQRNGALTEFWRRSTGSWNFIRCDLGTCCGVFWRIAYRNRRRPPLNIWVRVRTKVAGIAVCLEKRWRGLAAFRLMA